MPVNIFNSTNTIDVLRRTHLLFLQDYKVLRMLVIPWSHFKLKRNVGKVKPVTSPFSGTRALAQAILGDDLCEVLSWVGEAEAEQGSMRTAIVGHQ